MDILSDEVNPLLFHLFCFPSQKGSALIKKAFLKSGPYLKQLRPPGFREVNRIHVLENTEVGIILEKKESEGTTLSEERRLLALIR